MGWSQTVVPPNVIASQPIIGDAENELLYLQTKMQNLMFPMEIFCLLFVIGACSAMYHFHISYKFPSNLFRWILLIDIGYGIAFAFIKWAPYSGTFTGVMCSFEAAIDNFFQMASLYTNTIIVMTIFHRFYYLRRLDSKIESYVITGFWVISLVSFISAFISDTTSFIGWCVMDSVSLILKQVAWYLFMVIQICLLIPTNYLLWKAAQISKKQIQIDVYVRLSGVLASQTLAMAPLMIAEMNSITRSPLSTQMSNAIAVCFPLAHLIDAVLIGSRLAIEMNGSGIKKNSDASGTFTDSHTGSSVGKKSKSFTSRVDAELASKTGSKSGSRGSIAGSSSLHDSGYFKSGSGVVMRRVTKKKNKDKRGHHQKKAFDPKIFIRNTTTILMTPLVGLALMGSVSISRAGYNARLGSTATSTVPLGRAIVEFVHWTQQERGFSQVYMLGNRTKHLPTLHQKWANTDPYVPPLEAAYAAFDYEEVMDTPEFRAGPLMLADLGQARINTQDGLWSALDSFFFYTWMNGNMSACQVLIAQALRQDSVDYSLLSYLALSRAIEKTSEERQIGLVALQADPPGFHLQADYVVFTETYLREDAYLEIFDAFKEDDIKTFTRIQTDYAVFHEHHMNVRELLKLHDSQAVQNISAEFWWGNLTGKLDSFRQIEEEMTDFVSDMGERKMSGMVSLMRALMIVLVLLVAWTAFLVFHVVFSSTAPAEIISYLDRDCFGGLKFVYRQQIMLALFVPSIIMLVFFTAIMTEQVTNIQYYSDLTSYLAIMNRVSVMNREFQEERYYSVLYFDSEGQDNTMEDLTAQYGRTNTAIGGFLDFIVNKDTKLQQSDAWASLLNETYKLSAYRTDIWTAINIDSTAEVVNTYTNIVNIHLATYEAFIALARRNDFFYELLAYTLYLPGKERSGAERAKGVSGWVDMDWPSASAYYTFAFFAVSQKSWLELGRVYFTPEQIAAENELMAIPAVGRQQRWSADLMSWDSDRLAAEATVSTEWFGNATLRINQMLEVAHQIDKDLETETRNFAESSQTMFVIVCAVIISAFVMSDNFTTMIMWRLVKLRELARNDAFRSLRSRKHIRQREAQKKGTK